MTEDNSKIFDDKYKEKAPDFSKNINIAVVGKVSTGKSSLINAVLLRDKSDPIVKVGATSGVTTEVSAFKLDKNVLIFDSPGLDDIREKNNEETKKFLTNIDLGLMVVTGSADSTQEKNYEDLKNNAKKVFVVLNKSDEWDSLDESALEEVIKQWKKVLGVDHIYPTCTKGYDPKMKKDAPMDIRGVEELNEDVFKYLNGEGKGVLFAKHLGDKKKYAADIIATALVAVSVEAFIPGSAAYITATQVVAITSLHYVYTGEVLSKAQGLALVPILIGESIGLNAFLWIKSVLPPTGIVDVAASGVAITITFAMLSAVNYVLSNGLEINQTDELKEKYSDYKKSTQSGFKEEVISIIKGKGDLKGLIYKYQNV